MGKIKVNGMSCGHCKAAVEKAAGAVAGVVNPVVDLDKKELSWDESEPVDMNLVIKAVSDIGFEPERS